MASLTSKIMQIVLPKKKGNPTGTAYTNTFNPTQVNSVIGAPRYRDHLTDLFSTRTSQDSRALLKDLFKFDPDVSASVHAFLTVANTKPRFFVYNVNGELDRAGMVALEQILSGLTKRFDYSEGFKFTKSLQQIADECKYMILLTGGCSAELVFNKLLQPAEIRQVDLTKVEWFETAPGVYKPQQRTDGAQNPISLDIPNYFVKFYRQNPTEAYGQSVFVSAINTIASRQQVVNDIYRIMNKVGYPRLEVTVIEEILMKNAPADVKANPTELAVWKNTKMAEISAAVANIRPDDVFVHSDTIETGVMNEKGPSGSMDATAIIEILNAQNQAALKTMATVIGRGKAGTNTASVESRIFSMTADSLNAPVADLFSDMFSLALQLSGYQGYVECKFEPSELRPETELEPQKTMRQARLLENLSLGLITDDDYHIQMFGTIGSDSAPLLSGTGFMAKTAGVDANNVSPNADPLGRSITSPDSKSSKSNTIKKNQQKSK